MTARRISPTLIPRRHRIIGELPLLPGDSDTGLTFISFRNWYTVMDGFAASYLGYKPSDSNRYLRPSKYAMRFLDFWSMSLKRPDAHLKPATDCLHFCSPSIPEEWLSFLWHMTVTAADNNDYDDLPEGDSWYMAQISA